MYCEIEKGNFNLKDTLTINHDMTLEPYDPVSRMRNGSQVMVYDLLKHMIRVSDNEATNLLADRIGVPRLNEYFEEFSLKASVR